MPATVQTLEKRTKPRLPGCETPDTIQPSNSDPVTLGNAYRIVRYWTGESGLNNVGFNRIFFHNRYRSHQFITYDSSDAEAFSLSVFPSHSRSDGVSGGRYSVVWSMSCAVRLTIPARSRRTLPELVLYCQ